MISSNTIASVLEWFREARPNPNEKAFVNQLGVHCEEIVEMLMEVSTEDLETRNLILNAQTHMHLLAEHLKTNGPLVEVPPQNRQGFLDALVDQIVTATGCAHGQNMDIVGGLAEVDDSNWSKFEDGKAIFDETGKIAKGKNYRKANLEPFV